MTPRYVNDSQPGYRRQKCGKGWVFFDRAGHRLKRGDPSFKRISSLVIPPAWTQVWICADERGHIQATGRDARGRKQYIYHPEFRSQRDSSKFERLAAFAEALPQVREQVDRDLRARNFTRRKAQALALRLMERTFMRVGNRQYQKENGTHGITTLRSSHVEVEGAQLRLEFLGKSGKWLSVAIEDSPLARQMRRYQELPGDELFQYYDDEGELRHLDSGEVNAYLQEITGDRFTAKDFRTWGGTVLAAVELSQQEPWTSQAQLKRNLNRALRKVAARLGNTLSVCRAYYVHPAVVEAYSRAGGESLIQRFSSLTLAPPLGYSREEWLTFQLLGTPARPELRKAA